VDRLSASLLPSRAGAQLHVSGQDAGLPETRLRQHPSGSNLKGGTLSADLAISGPLDRLVIAGPVRMSNTKLAGFDMGSKLGALSAFSGKAPSSRDTTIQNASLNARIAPEVTRADAINVTIPSLGVVTGAGTISPAGALDFRMMADLQSERADARAQRTGRVAIGEVWPS
jgi:AsmA protein